MSQSLHLFNHASTPNLTFPSNTNTNTKQCYSYLPKPSSTYNRRFPLISIRASSSSDLDSSSPLLVSDNGKGAVISREKEYPVAAGSIEVDAVTETELKENGFRSTRRTKLVCTIGPSTCGFDQLESLAVGGMNVARINMCHGTRDWHRQVIQLVRRLNDEKGYAVAIMMDTEGSEIHMGDLGGSSSAKAEVSLSLSHKLFYSPSFFFFSFLFAHN